MAEDLRVEGAEDDAVRSLADFVQHSEPVRGRRGNSKGYVRLQTTTIDSQKGDRSMSPVRTLMLRRIVVVVVAVGGEWSRRRGGWLRHGRL